MSPAIVLIRLRNDEQQRCGEVDLFAPPGLLRDLGRERQHSQREGTAADLHPRGRLSDGRRQTLLGETQRPRGSREGILSPGHRCKRHVLMT